VQFKVMNIELASAEGLVPQDLAMQRDVGADAFDLYLPQGEPHAYQRLGAGRRMPDRSLPGAGRRS